jgi:outer membrane protein OmpA-like peptidoglycan-associated protein
MSPVLHGRTFFAAVGIAILGAVAIAAVISIKYPDRRTKPQAAIKQHIAKEMSEMNAAADATAGDSQGASGPHAANSPSPVAASASALAGSSSPASGGATSANASPVAAAPITPAAANGDRAHDWALKYERTVNGPEADLVVRTGDINNLGFGWPAGFDPFSGKSTPVHRFPWTPPPGEPDGTDRIMLGSAVDPADELRDPVAYNRLESDGYSGILSDCAMKTPPCKERQDSLPQPITLPVGSLPGKTDAVVLQIFVDDFQAARFHSHFQVSLNGTRIPGFEEAVNALDQTGPIGKLITVRLLPEYWPLLKSGEVKLLIDDPATKVRDGYAVDFARILVNPHEFKYQVSVEITVRDADRRTPIALANVSAALVSAVTDGAGKCELKGIPAGLVVATAAAPGYDANSVPVDLPAGEAARAEIQLHRHEESAAALERSIQRTGAATIYGIHFDTDSAKLRPDSLPALNAVLELVGKHPGSHWLIAGHTDNQGNAARNQPLSEKRASAVITWLKEHGADTEPLVPQGFGSTRPVADNATAGGRALNRRVELALAK